MLDEYRLVPLPINLLKYQSVREQSFSEIILQAVYQARGLSNRLDVAFFEEGTRIRERGISVTNSRKRSSKTKAFPTRISTRGRTSNSTEPSLISS